MTQYPTPDPVPDEYAWAALVALAEQRREQAYHAYVAAVGAQAAQRARYPAIQALGWQHQPGMGLSPEGDLANLAQTVVWTRVEYARWCRAVELVRRTER